MAATASSSNSVSNPPLPKQEPLLPKQEPKLEPKQEPVLPKQEPKLEPKQEPVLPKQEPKLEPKQEPNQERQQDVKSEIMEDIKEVKREPIDEMDRNQEFEKQQLEKFKRYEVDMKQYLIDKYFSDKDVFGGNIFDVKVQIDGKSTMASRLAPYQSYADPKAFQELLAKESTSVETKPDVGASNGKP